MNKLTSLLTGLIFITFGGSVFAKPTVAPLIVQTRT